MADDSSPSGSPAPPEHLSAHGVLNLAGMRVEFNLTVPRASVGPAAVLPVLQTLWTTIEADLMGGKFNANMPDMGILNQRYNLVLTGNSQELRLLSWDALPRVDVTIKYKWQPDIWYHMKLTSTVADAFVSEINKQIVEDTPIWEHKAFLPVPALADTDGPILKFRKWYSQFYAEPMKSDA